MKSDANERKGQHIHTQHDRPTNPVSLGHTPPAAQLVSRPTPNRTLHGQAQSFVRPSVEIIRINFPDRSYRKMTAVCSCFGRAADWLVGCPKCRRFLRFGLFWGGRHGSAGWGLSTCLRRVCGNVPPLLLASVLLQFWQKLYVLYTARYRTQLVTGVRTSNIRWTHACK